MREMIKNMLKFLIIYLFIISPINAIQRVEEEYIVKSRILYPNSNILQSIYNRLACLQDLGAPSGTAIHINGDHAVEIYISSRLERDKSLGEAITFCRTVFPVRVIFRYMFHGIDEYSGRAIGSLESLLKGDKLLPHIEPAKPLPRSVFPNKGTKYLSLFIKKCWYRILYLFWSGVDLLIE